MNEKTPIRCDACGGTGLITVLDLAGGDIDDALGELIRIAGALAVLIQHSDPCYSPALQKLEEMPKEPRQTGVLCIYLAPQDHSGREQSN
jgi:hypothetical protein